MYSPLRPCFAPPAALAPPLAPLMGSQALRLAYFALRAYCRPASPRPAGAGFARGYCVCARPGCPRVLTSLPSLRVASLRSLNSLRCSFALRGAPSGGTLRCASVPTFTSAAKPLSSSGVSWSLALPRSPCATRTRPPSSGVLLASSVHVTLHFDCPPAAAKVSPTPRLPQGEGAHGSASLAA